MIDWIQQHIPPWVFIAIIAHLAITGTVAYLILLERKVASWAQDRLGPNRVGPWGLLQPIADGIKMLVKEDYRAKHIDVVLFTIAPMAMILVIIVSIAALPWGGAIQTTKTIEIASGGNTPALVQAQLPGGATIYSQEEYDTGPLLDYTGTLQPARRVVTVTYRWPFIIANLNVGVLFILAVLSLAVYGVVIGGWASNNKYSFLGALRATAQMVSYEIPLGLAVLAVVVMFGTLDLSAIVDRQVHYWGGIVPAWNVFCQPFAFLLFLVCIHAEANRAPFDLAEAEQELVGGYHTEYSAMRFGLFFLAEYAGMITTSVICVALFFGGWHIPWLDKIWPALSGIASADGTLAPENVGATTSIVIAVIRAAVIFGKSLFFIFVFMWVRWSLPRMRFDQLMQLAWAGLIPVSLGILTMTTLVVYFYGPSRGLIPGAQGAMNLAPIGGKMALWLLGGNVVVVIAMGIMKKLLPAPRNTNRKLRVAGSRFRFSPLPAGVKPSIQPIMDNA